MFFPEIYDAYFPNVSLLLPMTGENNSTTFTDASLLSNAITCYGNTKISTAQSKWGNGSGYFDGDGDYLVFSNALANWAGDFTIECWFKLAALPTGMLWNTSFYLYSAGPNNSDSGFEFALGNTGLWLNTVSYTSRVLTASWTPDTSAWHHMALTRSGDTWEFFIDGDSVGSVSDSSTLYNNSTATIGNVESGDGGTHGGFFNGYLQDYRITKGIARYTNNFTPPLTPFFPRLSRLEIHQAVMQSSFQQAARLGL